MKGKFQYQYRYQYFEIADFNININIDMTNILVFQYFSIYCPTSATDTAKVCQRRISCGQKRTSFQINVDDDQA